MPSRTSPPPNALFSSSPSPAPDEQLEVVVEGADPSRTAPLIAGVGSIPTVAPSSSEYLAGTNPRKRPSLPAQDRPPTKRERKDASQDQPRRRVFHETAVAAWDALRVRHPERTDFTQRELAEVAEAEWKALSPPERLFARWKRDFNKFLKRPGMFRRAERGDAPPNSLVMADRTFKSVPAKRKGTEAQTGKRGEVPATAVEGGENGVDGLFTKASVPAEWKREMYKPVRLSPFDKSVGLSFVNESENVVTAIKGFRTIRATTGVCSGDWFFEATVLPTKNSKAAVRLGWSMRRCDAETPVGFDAYSYGLRDRSGEFVHLGYRKPYGESFGVGDVIGCRIVLPKLTEEQHERVLEADEKWLHWRFVAYKQGPPPPDNGVDLWPRGRVEFYKNGQSMGVPSAFQLPIEEIANESVPGEDEKANGAADESEKIKEKKGLLELDKNKEKKGLLAGYYYPSISIFKDGVVQANFGPNFKYGLPDGSRPMHEAAKDPPEENSVGEVRKPTENGHIEEKKDMQPPEQAPPVNGHYNGRAYAEMETEKANFDNPGKPQLTALAHVQGRSSPEGTYQIVGGDCGEKVTMNLALDANQVVREAPKEVREFPMKHYEGHRQREENQQIRTG